MSFLKPALIVMLCSAPFAIGCMPLDDEALEEEENTSETYQEVVLPNSILPNSILPNSILPNSILPNAILPNSLAASSLNSAHLSPAVTTPLQDPGQVGEVSRNFFKYMLGCALDSGQSYNLTWYDTAGVQHNETYVGYLGLAKGWPDKPLSPSEQEWITACLLSRTNWYGVTVLLSSRAQQVNLKVTEPNELTDYANFEGAFWGNIFADTPTAYSCHNSARIAYARAAHRDCAAGHLNDDGTTSNCGIIQVVGDCDSHCTTPDATNGFYPQCGLTLNGTDKTQRVISVFLP